MADALKKIRVKFLNGANKEQIDDLLDGLYDDGVFKVAEKDSIIQENRTPINKARALIDMVIKKGDVASNKMIALIESDKALRDTLGLPEKPAQPDPAPEPQLGQKGPAAAPEPQLEQKGPAAAPEPQLEQKGPAAAPEPQLEQKGPAAAPEPQLGQKGPAAAPEPQLEQKGPAAAPEPQLGQKGPAAAPEPQLGQKGPAAAPEPQLEQKGPAAAPEPQLGQDGSGTLIHSTKAFWKGKQGQGDTYPADQESIRHRVALLITNIKFTDTRVKDRAGADRDEKNMLKLLVALGYEVVEHRNLTGKGIEAAVIKFSKHEKLKKTDSVVVVIMSHGKRGAILGVDWKKNKPDEFSIDNIYLHLGSKGCPALLDKPKIILIQACRGGKEGSVMVEDGLSCDDASLYAGHEDFEEDGVRIVNKEIDFLALLSSTPDTVSYRDPQLGSPLIRYFVAVVNTSAHVDHIEELCRKVQQRFVDLKVTKQMPTKDRGTLIRHFYFFPGI